MSRVEDAPLEFNPFLPETRTEPVSRFPKLELAAETFARRQMVTLRGLKSVPVAIR
jgi:hypothetical protein